MKWIYTQKCTQLNSKQLRSVNPKEWICKNCTENMLTPSDLESDLQNLDEHVKIDYENVDFKKYDNMIFNPLTFDCDLSNKGYDVVPTNNSHDCLYMTPQQFSTDKNAHKGQLNLMNVNIRSISKNFDSLKEFLKSTNTEFAVIGISETHLKDKPSDIYNLSGYNIEFTNRVGREKGGVCLYISEQIKYKVRKDLCLANNSYESCFIGFPGKHKDIVVGTIYRSHTPIENFIKDVEPIYNKLASEKKQFYIMGDFNIDLLKVDTDKQTHDYIDFIYSHAILPINLQELLLTQPHALITYLLIIKIYSNPRFCLQMLVTTVLLHYPLI